jgi:phosphate transport system permease protein
MISQRETRKLRIIMGSKNDSGMFKKEYLGRSVVTVCGILIIALTLIISIFLIVKGSGTFTIYHHSVFEFLFSDKWSPSDVSGEGGGNVGARIYILGSLMTCGLALLIALPFSLAAAIFISEISPDIGGKYLQPAIEIFVGIPSVVYGWVGLRVLVPFIRDKFNAPMGGYSVLAAGIVLAIMIFPTITTLSADALRALPDSYRLASYGLGASRWQVIYTVLVPAAKNGILSGVILGLSRAFGETLAVAMVIGKTRVLPKGILYPTNNLTAAIAADMGNTANGSEYNLALWTMALLLLIISLACIIAIHIILRDKKEKND